MASCQTKFTDVQLTIYENHENYIPQKFVYIWYEMEGLFHVHAKDQLNYLVLSRANNSG